MIKVYTASKLKHAPLWKQLKEEWIEIEFVARWPFFHVGNIPDTSYYAKVFWKQDLEDVQLSDIVLVYAEEGDKLRGALVEAGMAIALGKEVIVVGESPDYGTWTWHSNVYRVSDLTDARLLLGCMSL
jgi:nucleoside 2-deoxyribosyltransferase